MIVKRYVGLPTETGFVTVRSNTISLLSPSRPPADSVKRKKTHIGFENALGSRKTYQHDLLCNETYAIGSTVTDGYPAACRVSDIRANAAWA